MTSLQILTLQTSTFGAYGGIPTYNRLVCRTLNELDVPGNKVVLLATDKAIDVKQPAIDLPHVRLEAFAGNRRRFVQRVIRPALGQRIDLALIGHVNYAPLGLLLRRLQPQLRYGVMIYGIDVWSELSRWRRKALQDADFVTSISEYTVQRAIEVNGAITGHTYLLPNALEWLTDEVAGESAVPLLPVGTRLLSVCRLDSSERYKGVDTVIESMPTVLAQVPDAHYVIVGDGTDHLRLQALAEEAGIAGRVHFLGNLDDAALRRCYQTCDVFVMPSSSEGFGFVFLEAMHYRKPVVAADSGGSPEVVLDDVTGRLVRYGDVPQLAQTLIELCRDPQQRARLGQAGYERLQAHYTFPKFKQTLSDIISRELPSAAYKSRRAELVRGRDIGAV